jgi:ferredoxin-NADP reductase/ferredoxin
MKYFRAALSVLLPVALLLAQAPATQAQTDHASHHPDQAAAGTSGPAMAPAGATSAPSGGMAGMGGASAPSGGMGGGAVGAKPGGMGGAAGAGGMGGGMGDMGEMMKEMTKTPPMPLYPNMMQDPNPEQRSEARMLANERMSEGSALLTAGLNNFTEASSGEHQDFGAMQQATQQIRSGQSLLESGLATQRALAQNNDPRTAALQWFNGEMNLAPRFATEQPHGFFGLTWFHYVVMLTLAAFVAAMMWMYFHKMQRANALVEKLTGTPAGGSAAPGAASPGGPAPAAAGAAKPTGGAPVPVAPPAGAAKPAASAPPEAKPGGPSKPNAFKGTLLVSEIFEETPTVKTFRLTDVAGGKLPFVTVPGQFLGLAVIPNGKVVNRSYTIASSPTQPDYCEITVKHEDQGIVSSYLHQQVHVGELLQITAPSGKFTFTEPDGDSVVLIAGGVGVTPFMSIIRYLTDRSWKGDIYLFFTCKNKSSIIFREELEYLQERYPNLHVFIVLTRPEGPLKDTYLSGHITKEMLDEHVPEIATRRIHICGPPKMIDAVSQMLNELDVPKENVKTELFASPPPEPPGPKGGGEPAAGGAGPPPAAPPAAAVPAAGAPAAAAAPAAEPAGPPPAPPPESTAPAAESILPPPAADAPAAAAAVVTFAKSNKTAVLTPDKSILEASEDIGVNIDYQCRVGTCGVCKTPMLSGNVTMAVQDALTDEDKAQNIILACQAKATGPVTVDA